MFNFNFKFSAVIVRVIAALATLSIAYAQTASFTSGNIVVTRSVYAGDMSTVTIGQQLPPICPAIAACGTAKAPADGSYLF